MLVWLQTAVDSVYGVISDTVLRFFPLINLILMIIAGCFGSLLVGKIKPALRDALLRGLGLLVLLMGCTELWNGFFVLQVGQFETTGTMLVVVSLVLGYGLGLVFRPERGLGRLGLWLSRKFLKDKQDKLRRRVVAAPTETAEGMPDGAPVLVEILPARPEKPHSAEGFMLASVICAFGSPTVFGVLGSGYATDALPLLWSIGFHVVVMFVLNAVFGSSCSLAAIPVLVVEGILWLVGFLWGDLLTYTLVSQIRLIGAAVLLAAGIALGMGKRVRAARLIPAYLFPVIYGVALLLVRRMMESD